MPGDMLWCLYLDLPEDDDGNQASEHLYSSGKDKTKDDIIVDVKLIVDEKIARSNRIYYKRKQHTDKVVVSKRKDSLWAGLGNRKPNHLLVREKKKKLLKSLPPVVPITTIKKWTRQG